MKKMTAWTFCVSVLLACDGSAGLILSGSGSIASGPVPSTAFQQASDQAFALADWSVVGDLSAGQTVGIAGSMQMTGATGNFWDDRLVIGVANPTGTFFPTNPDLVGRPFSLLGQVSAANAVGAPLQTAYGSGSGTTTLGVASANRTVDYILNITLAATFENGFDGPNAHAHGYELSFDVDNDGIFEFTETGILNSYEDNRLRIGFGVIQSGGRGVAELLTNTYDYHVFDAAFPASNPIPEPATVVLLAVSAMGALAVRATRPCSKKSPGRPAFYRPSTHSQK